MKLFLITLVLLGLAFAGIAIPGSTDDLFPLIATGGYLPQVVGVFFIVGLVAAAYSSADSALMTRADVRLGGLIREDDVSSGSAQGDP